MLEGTQLMVDFHGGNKLACLSLPSFVECLEELLILLLEDLIPHCYLVVLSFQLIDFSLKKNSFSFLLSLFRTMCKGGVILCAVASFASHVGEGCLVKRKCTNDRNQLDTAEESRNKCRFPQTAPNVDAQNQRRLWYNRKCQVL
ncbi:hypothetical protein EV2_018597 [Malus domestica]